MFRLGSACLFVACLTLSPAQAEEGWGKYLDETHVSLYYTHDQSEDVVLSMICERQSGAVTVLAPSAIGETAEHEAFMSLTGASGAKKLSAGILPNVLTGSNDLVASTDDPKPILALITQAGKLTLDLDGHSSELPLDAKAVEAAESFKRSCPSAH